MDAYLGQIILFAGNFAPKNWAPCDGRLLSIAQNQALFSLLGTIYGGNGVQTFALPDLRGRLPVGQGQAAGGSNYTLGEAAGAETATLLSAQMPAHTHPLQASTAGATSTDPTNNVLAAVPASNVFYDVPASPAPIGLGPDTVAPAGGNQPHSNMMPTQTLTYLICVYGLFPSRS